MQVSCTPAKQMNSIFEINCRDFSASKSAGPTVGLQSDGMPFFLSRFRDTNVAVALINCLRFVVIFSVQRTVRPS